MTKEEAIKMLKSMRVNIEQRVDSSLWSDVNEATDMAIEALKVQPEWIPCREKMPKEKEWIGTKKIGTTISDTVYVTFENSDGKRFTKHLRFQNGKLSSSDQQSIDVFFKGSVPIAWMPLPEPWKGGEEE